MVTRIYYVGTDDAIVYAASELKRVLERMEPKSEIAVCAMKQKAEYKGYWLGLCGDLYTASPVVADARLDDGYSIHTHGEEGIIAGVNARSVLLAVYRYLRELGCAWIRPGATGEILPKTGIADRAVSICEAASYRHRGVCIEGAVSYDHVAEMLQWLPKLGMNGYFNQFWTPFSFYDNWYQHAYNPSVTTHPVTREEVDGFVRDQMQYKRRQQMMYHAAGHGWTCAPFGLDSCGWYPHQGELPEGMRDLIALVDNKRELFNNIPLNTNLCYTNPVVKEKIVDEITKYCLEHKDVDYLHFWLADAMNNQCECSECKKLRPADHYIDLLNMLDERLTAANIAVRVVFLIYFDLMWRPVQNKIKNPDRFVLMFAPISRTYTTSYADADIRTSQEVLPFEYNKLKLPRSVGENVAFLRDWQQVFEGDSFIYDYHLWRDYTLDAGFAQISKVLFQDMQYLHLLGINGMMSCQSQRVFYPSPLPMLLMADALWNDKADYELCVNDHYAKAYGELGPQVRTYLETLSKLVDSSYMRNEKKAVDEEMAANFIRAEEHIHEFLPVIKRRTIETNACDDAVKRSYEILENHAGLCLLLIQALKLKAAGDQDAALSAWEKTVAYAQKYEMAFQHEFDVSMFLSSVGNSIHNKSLFGA